jgi:parvulin-like peptidyl-prolyl isomerase
MKNLHWIPFAALTVLVLVSVSGCRNDAQPETGMGDHLILGMDRYYEDPKYNRFTGPASGRDRVLARVNEEAIRREQLDERLVGIVDLRTAEGKPTDPETMDHIRARLLDALISLTVERQEAVRLNPEVTDEEIKEFIDELKSGLGEGENLEKELEAAGISEEEFRKISRREAQVIKLREGIFNEEVPEPSEEEVLEYYRNVAWPSWYNVRTRSVFIEAPQDLSPLERRQKRDLIEMLRARAAEGADFASLAQEYSDDENTRDSGGDNGLATLSVLPPPVRRALKDLAIGGITDVVEINFPPGKEGFAIFKVTDVSRRPASDPRVRQVLIEEIKGRKKQERYRQWLIEKRNESRIVILDTKIRQILGGA